MYIFLEGSKAVFHIFSVFHATSELSNATEWKHPEDVICSSVTTPDFVYKSSSDASFRLETSINYTNMGSIHFYAWDSGPAGFEFKSGCKALTTIVIFGRKSASYWTQSAATAAICKD